MDNPLQLVAWLALFAVAVVSCQFVINQYRLFRTARETAQLEHDLLRERIGLVAEQRRKEREREDLSWNGFRKFRIAEKVMEAQDICSFHLAPHDGKPLPTFLPGQYLTFQLKVPGQPKPLVRCYSLSERPGISDRYRVTIKRVPKGVVSNHFHDHLNVGDIVDVKAPSGQFILDLQQSTPVVLIAGGVGITPVLSMLNAIANGGCRREVWFFYGVRNGQEHAMKKHLKELASMHPSLHLNVCYSDVTDEDRGATPPSFQHGERVSVDLLQKVLPSSDFSFYICGPPPMMEAMIAGLKTWGVPEERIFFEAFGAATVKRPALQAPGSTTTQALKIQFGKSGKTCAWRADAGSLLELAEKEHIPIDSGCRAGNCGTCLVAIKSGEVKYLKEPGFAVEAGSCLTCISVPKTALVLDA
jgi:ferredoxin-NADP reductase